MALKEELQIVLGTLCAWLALHHLWALRRETDLLMILIKAVGILLLAAAAVISLTAGSGAIT